MSSAEEKPSTKRSRDSAHKSISKRKVEKGSRQLDIEKNPCVKEQEMSYHCLDQNAYDHDKCSKHFLNYNLCRKFWHLVILDRKGKNIKPHLPPPDERKQALQDYKHILPWK